LPSDEAAVGEAAGQQSGRRLRLVAFVMILLAVPVSLLIQRAFDDSADPLTSGPAPDFTLTDIDGEQVSLDALAGQPVVLHFWGSWCEPCDFQFELLAAARKKFPDVTFLGILFRDDPDDARRYAQDHDADWPILLDEAEQTAADYGVEGVPLTFFIDRDGEIAGSMVNEYARPQLERQIRRIL
jgi:cytochrome c biogenesis protein CcmG/thiol:disulfide interchange protein DsbE